MSVPILIRILGGLLMGAGVFSLHIPASALQTSSPPPGPSSSDDRLYMVRVGPVSDRDRAAAIAKQLSAGGFSQTKVTSQTGFRVVSEPLPRSVAEGLVATLAGRGIRSQVEPLGGDTAQLLFGFFTSQKEAETLAQRIGAAGYDAWVREGAVYTLQLGPYPLSAVNTITGIIKSGAPDAAVSTDPPISPQASPSPPAPAPQASPPPPASAPQISPPAPASAPQISPPPPGPSSSNDLLYMVRVGPVSDRDRAAAIAKQLSAGGFSQTKVTSQTGFRVVSEPLPRSVAEGLVATLAGRGIRSQVEPLGGDAAQLYFGILTSQKEAETLAQRIGAAGYDAWVREGAVYTLQLGPYPLSAVNTITGIIKSGAPDAAVTADPPLPTTAQAPGGAPATSSQPATSAPSQPAKPAPSQPAPQAPSQPAKPAPSQPAPQAPSQPASWGPSQAPVAAPSQPIPPASPSTAAPVPFLIIPGQSVGPVRLGMPVREETAQLGASKGSAELVDRTMTYRWFEPPSNAGIGVRTAQNGAVLRVWVLNDERYRTKEGLHVGSTEAEVRAALGNPTLIDINVQGKTRTLIYESLGLWFSIQLDRQYKFYNAVFDIGVMAKK